MSDRIIKKSVLVLILVLLLFSSVVYAEVEESTSTMVGSQKEWVVINKVSSCWNGRLLGIWLQNTKSGEVKYISREQKDLIKE